MRRRLLRGFLRAPRTLVIGLVRLYQLAISPHFPSSCRYTPTCSAYAIEALDRFGLIRGSLMALYRILRCHPWSKGGYDPPRWFGREE